MLLPEHGSRASCVTAAVGQCIRCRPDWDGAPRCANTAGKLESWTVCNGPELLAWRSGSAVHTSCLQDASVPWQGSPEEDILAAWRKRRQVRGSSHELASGEQLPQNSQWCRAPGACRYLCLCLCNSLNEPNAHLPNPQQPASRRGPHLPVPATPWLTRLCSTRCRLAVRKPRLVHSTPHRGEQTGLLQSDMLCCCLQVALQGAAHLQGAKPSAGVRCTVSSTKATHLPDAMSTAHPSQLQLSPTSVSEAGLSVAAAPRRGTQARNAATQQAAAGLLPTETRAETGLSADASALWPPAMQGAPMAEGPGSPLHAGSNRLAECTGGDMCTPQAGQQGSSRLPGSRGGAANPGGVARPLQPAGGHCSEASPASSFTAGRQAAPLTGHRQGFPAAAAGCLLQQGPCCQGAPEHGAESGQATGQAGADWGSPGGGRSSCGDSRSAGVAAACSSQQQGKQPQAGAGAVSPATAAPIGSEGAGSPSSCTGLALCGPSSPRGTGEGVTRGSQAVHEGSGAGSGTSEAQQLASGCDDAAAGRRVDAPGLGCSWPGDRELQPLQSGSPVPCGASPDQPPCAAAAACAEQPVATSVTGEPAASPVASGEPAAQGSAAAAEAKTLWEADAGLCAAAGGLSLHQAAETEEELRGDAGGLSLHQAAAAEAGSSEAADGGGGRPAHCSRLPGDMPRRAEGAAPTRSERGPGGGGHGETAAWRAADRRPPAAERVLSN